MSTHTSVQTQRLGSGISLFLNARAGKFLAKLVILAVIATGAVFFIIPFLWMISTAGKEGALIWKVPPVWIPPNYEWSNYIEGWRILPFDTFYFNTVKITILTVGGVLFSSSLAAFAFARLRFPGRELLFIVVLSTMMLPYHVTMIPQYMLYTKLGWVNTHKPLWVQWWFGDAFSIFLLRQFFMTIPLDAGSASRRPAARQPQPPDSLAPSVGSTPGSSPRPPARARRHPDGARRCTRRPPRRAAHLARRRRDRRSTSWPATTAP